MDKEFIIKKVLLISLLLIVGCGSDTIKLESNNLIDRGGLMYAPNDDEPFTGIVFDFYENGEKKLDGNYRKGLMNGKWTYYYENGQKKVEAMMKDGKLDEKATRWHENGKKESEGTYKNGEQDGLWTEWYENGQKSYEGTFKDGLLDGSPKKWNEDGSMW